MLKKKLADLLIDGALWVVMAGYKWAVSAPVGLAVGFVADPGRDSSPVGVLTLWQKAKALLVAVGPVAALLLAHQAGILALVPEQYKPAADALFGLLALLAPAAAGHVAHAIRDDYQTARK